MCVTTVLYLTKNKPGLKLSNVEWADIGTKFNHQTNTFYELDADIKKLCLSDFYKMLEILHGRCVKNDDCSFSLYPQLMKQTSEKQLHLMLNIINKWFMQHARTLYDSLDCIESLKKSVVLGRNDQNLVYVYFRHNIITLQKFLSDEMDKIEENGCQRAKYYIADIRGRLK